MKFLSLQVFTAVAAALAIRQHSVAAELNALVSPASQVKLELPARWSTYNLLQPAVVVDVTCERDVASVVEYCTKNGIPFVAQNGGIGWAKTFNLGKNGVLINLAGLNAITFSQDKKQATIGGGAKIGDVVPAANAAGALVITGNCNCVGALGAMLGGGYGNLMGEVGFGADNIISMRVVLANGTATTVSKDFNTELFWAMRGAGPNFGIVTSVTVASQPATPEDRTAFMNTFFFAPDKLTQVAQAIEDLPLTPQQSVYLILTSSGPPSNTPAILVTGFARKATLEEGHKLFAPLYALNPESTSSTIAPYNEWNAGNDPFCGHPARKPAYSATITSMQSQKWPDIWSLYTAFQAKAPDSVILIERYNLTKATSIPANDSALNDQLRNNAFAQAIVIPWYTSEDLDAEAEKFGADVRSIWSEGEVNKPTYSNFAHGDESQEAIYGSSLGRLREVKKMYDPQGVFNQWFAITPAP